MDPRDDRIATDTDRNTRKRSIWPWLLLPLLLLLLLAFLLQRNNADNNLPPNTQGQTTTESAQSLNNDTQPAAALKQKYEAQFNSDARAIYFNPNTSELQDETAAAAKLDAIVAFVKENPTAKIQVNGSIFDDQQIDSASSLAKERAEIIKQRLTEKGVSQDNLTVSTVDSYEGQDDAARAMYARSVVITVTN